MTYRNSENFRVPEFCENCPALEDIETPVVVRMGKVVDPLCVYLEPGGSGNNGFYGQKSVLVTDRDNPKVNPAYLGEHLPGDAFCRCCEDSTSRVLGKTHKKVQECAVPETKSSFFGLRKVRVCGAGIMKASKAGEFDEHFTISDEELAKPDIIA